MSVAYEPRNFIHEGAYPSMGDEHDQRYTDSDVAEQLSHYTTEAGMLPDDRDVMGHDRGMMPDDSGVVDDTTRLDLGVEGFSSPMQAPVQPPQVPDQLPESKDTSPSAESPPSRAKGMSKPERDVVKQADGKFHCPLADCKEEVRAFSRKCEWNKHMDKHERPYRCLVAGCENLPGFTYSGGLLRHEREVHGKHGGPKNTVNCPHPNCKRHTGKGFSRQENLNEHLRRVHTNPDGETPPTEAAQSPDDNESEKSGIKRKRRSSGGSHSNTDEVTELRDEVKRLREENKSLRAEVAQDRQDSLSMMAQIAQLQEALRHGLGQPSLGAPTAQMM
ncbi:hypothetical protein ACRE_041410 [Hapsidospora chrysogenum ATCC 11550]|uniref:C2H2-type domain-containing protein n=1 Tax=Hapsidospora chrysogenum (strain ATCC 11550 / CBS 779.69 / DSM 880 / IAM 14645 / JCM 23072 / IMI 49137) TaxID=857340 RepID=A0A086T6P9_HAPC1|nr:hypothetical protein ACRE_041410 [Hapsidospora chrysogenum ATCC 11550]